MRHIGGSILAAIFLLTNGTNGFSPTVSLTKASGARAIPALPLQPLSKASPITSSTTTTSLEAAMGAQDFLFNSDVWVFIAGIFPFMWATYEFWRRIMFGETFGTGTDSVIIGMEDSPQDSRGVRVLGRGALITAYTLFVIAFGTLGVVLYSVVTSEAPTEEALAAAAAAVEQEIPTL